MDGVGRQLRLFSANAAKVELCIFDEQRDREIERIDLPEFTDEIWHGFLPDARPGTIYGYRVEARLLLQSQQASARSPRQGSGWQT